MAQTAAVHTSETSIYFNDTAQRYISESYLHNRGRDDLKYHNPSFD
jgi:hypothetical protein